METYTTTTYNLTTDDCPVVVPLPASVSLHHPGWSDMPHGFSINFLPTHLPLLRALCTALERLDDTKPGMLTIDLDDPPTRRDLASAINAELYRLGWSGDNYDADEAAWTAFPTTETDIIRLEGDETGCCVRGEDCLMALRALQTPCPSAALWDTAITPYLV